MALMTSHYTILWCSKTAKVPSQFSREK